MANRFANRFAIRHSDDASGAFEEEEYEDMDLPSARQVSSSQKSFAISRAPDKQDPRTPTAPALHTNRSSSESISRAWGDIDESEQQTHSLSNLNQISFSEPSEYNTHQTTGDDRNKNVSGGFAQKDAGKGWGTFSSWINTAVSTVSEVIENPNVVVSKAQTLGQGLRHVATEQIDRVYESLDPEYDYQKERQLKQDQQHNQQRQISVSPAMDQPSSTFQKQDFYPNPSQQLARSGPMKHQAFDGAWPQHPQTSTQELQHSSDLQKPQTLNTLAKPASLAGNLIIKDTDHNGDGWEEDAWGDEWDTPIGIVGADPLPVELPAQKQDATTNPDQSTVKQTAPSFGTTPIPQLVEAQESQESNLHNGFGQSRNTRDVKDLFSMEPRGSTTSHGTGAARNLAVSSEHGRNQSESPIPRKPSADLRPAEALFSTLDFASNALGNAVLGVHRKVTQASQSQSSSKSTARAEFGQARPISPIQNPTPQPSPYEPLGGREVIDTMDRLSSASPSLEVVSGNVMSTGLGALEILGKKAVDVISDVIPPKMNLASLFEDAGGRAHLVAMRSLASSSASRITAITVNRPDLLEMGQLDDLESLLGPVSLNMAVTDLSVDLLAGHRDFRSMVTLLERMGVQGTSHLRLLRNGTRKLTTLVPDSVNAFGQEWHNHQSRANERDFFARVPIKKFFESKLLSIYSDGLRSISQFTHKTCDQALRLADNFHRRLGEKVDPAVRPSGVSNAGVEQERLPPLVLAQLLQQFLGKLISELIFIAKTYCLALDAVLQAAKGFTTPLDHLDWEDLAMGIDNVKDKLTQSDIQEAIGFIHSGAVCIMDVLKNELVVDALHGKLVPKARIAQSKEASGARSPQPASLSPSPSLRPRTEQQNPTLTPYGGQATRAKVPPQSTTPVLSTSSTIELGSNDTTHSQSLATRRPSSVSSQSVSRPTKAPAPPVRPVLKDEDFFSILNEPTG
ncbi:hypothetical protein BGX34_012231 [Mortierella sp. NVP85]|nr:hypothetical protein BGX34_012231 [Mortierella sp. NVP85]